MKNTEWLIRPKCSRCAGAMSAFELYQQNNDKLVCDKCLTQNEMDSRVELLQTQKNVLRYEIEQKEAEISRMKKQLARLEDAVYMFRT